MSRPVLAERLRLVDQRAEVSLRRQRIEELSVDHSRAGYGIPGLTSPVPARCMESEAREPAFQHIRSETRLAERMAAWQGLSGNVYSDFMPIWRVARVAK